MKKIFAYLLLFCFASIYVLCSSSLLMKVISKNKFATENILLRSEKQRYGDLFGISYLSHFKNQLPKYRIKEIISKSKLVNLYIIGDSYLLNNTISKNFYSVDTVYYTQWKHEEKEFKLDTNKQNILIIETVERQFISRFCDSTNIKFAFSNKPKKKKILTLSAQFEEFVFNKKINDNLEFILFDNIFFTIIKQLRADINYMFFNKIPPKITISSNKDYLFLTETIDTTLNTSSFKKVDGDELNKCIRNCNTMTNFYLKNGFDKVYFSIIPNPVSVLGYQDYKYNNLIPKIQTLSIRDFETIDVFFEFSQSPDKYFYHSDSHWNSAGLQTWVDKVNKLLK